MLLVFNYSFQAKFCSESRAVGKQWILKSFNKERKAPFLKRSTNNDKDSALKNDVTHKTHITDMILIT